MDFLGFLRDLFGGGQKPAAPPKPQPAPARQTAAPSFLQRAQAAPAAKQSPSPFPGAQAAPAQPFPRAFQSAAPRPAQPQQQAGGWQQSNRIAQAAAQPHPYVAQANELAQEANPYSGRTAQKFEDKRKAEEKQNNFFGEEGSYAAEQMSVDAYLALTPMQRAAVDANTALIQAAEEDTASWAKQKMSGKPIEDKDYFNKVKGAFGDNRGSDTYAPRTMAVLEDLGLNLQGKDLDQYLNLSALVTADDLNTLTPGAAAANPRQENAAAFAQAASTRLSETLASGQTLLDSIRSGSDAGRQLFGAPATMAPVGYTESERDKDLRDAFNVFAQAQSQQDLTPETVGGVYAELQEKHGVTPNEVAQYFETRLQANEYLNVAGEQSVSLAPPGVSLEYLTPADFRAKYLQRGE